MNWPGELARELGRIRNALTILSAEVTHTNRKLDHMSDQQSELNTDIEALTAVVTDVSAQTATLGTDLTAVAAEITDLEAKVAAGQAVDLSGLTGLVAAAQSSQAALDSAVAVATGLVPVPVTPPEPTPTA